TYVDQKILPLVAQVFSSQVGCMRHQGYNVAYWNLHGREITRVDNKYLINGQPAVNLPPEWLPCRRSEHFLPIRFVEFQPTASAKRHCWGVSVIHSLRADGQTK